HFDHVLLDEAPLRVEAVERRRRVARRVVRRGEVSPALLASWLVASRVTGAQDDDGAKREPARGERKRQDEPGERELQHRSTWTGSEARISVPISSGCAW